MSNEYIRFYVQMQNRRVFQGPEVNDNFCMGYAAYHMLVKSLLRRILKLL